MYITVSKSNLVKTLSHLYRIVEKKSTIPGLSNVKIEISKPTIKSKKRRKKINNIKK